MHSTSNYLYIIWVENKGKWRINYIFILIIIHYDNINDDFVLCSKKNVGGYSDACLFTFTEFFTLVISISFFASWYVLSLVLLTFITINDNDSSK